MTRKPLSRRTILRGVGAAVSLPLLEAMLPARSALAASAGGQALATTPAGFPRRMAVIFTPHGAHMPNFTPAAPGRGYEMPWSLKPLTRFREDINVLTGLTHDRGRANADGAGDHARSASVFLTGAQPRKTSGADIRSGISIDQFTANHIGKLTPFASLELGIEGGRNAGNCDSGYSCAYSSNISWAGPGTPTAKETNPKLVFERLFGGSAGGDPRQGVALRDAQRRSILDFVLSDAKSLSNTLGRPDQRKLDEYLSGVRDIEKRMNSASRPEPDHPGYLDYPAPQGVPADYAEHLHLMADMMVLAFQTDLTRITTYMFANAGSNRSYRPIGVPEGHHDISHHGGDPVKHDKLSHINRFHAAQFAYLLDRLRSIPEGDGTLLDNCMIMYGSGISDGNRHNNENLPLILAGRGGGTIHTGRHIVYDTETPVCNLFVSMLDRMGVHTDRFSDSTGRLPYLG